MMLMLEATRKNGDEENFEMEGSIEDAIDSEQEGAPVASRNIPFDLPNGATTNKKKWKANLEVQGHRPIGDEGAVEARNQPRIDIDLDPRMPGTLEKAGVKWDIIDIFVDVNNLNKALKIGNQLGKEMGDQLTAFLKDNRDVFVWCHRDMVGIDPKVMYHHLNIDSEKREIRKKGRPISKERASVVQEEVDKLLVVGLIKKTSLPHGWPILCWLESPMRSKGHV